VLTHYLQEDPDTEELWYYLAIAQKKMGNYLAALESSKKVYEIKPDNLNNLVNLADLYRLNGNSTEARIFSEKVLIMDSQNKHAKRIIEILDGAQNN
jgi:tetratricopeptide (TPR) repeat protein